MSNALDILGKIGTFLRTFDKGAARLTHYQVISAVVSKFYFNKHIVRKIYFM